MDIDEILKSLEDSVTDELMNEIIELIEKSLDPESFVPEFDDLEFDDLNRYCSKETIVVVRRKDGHYSPLYMEVLMSRLGELMDLSNPNPNLLTISDLAAHLPSVLDELELDIVFHKKT